MQKQKLVVAVIDDDGLTERAEVFQQYFKEEADKAIQNLDLRIYTSMPDLNDLRDANTISWDNDLGVGGDVIRMLRTLFFSNPEKLEVLKDKIHIIHSMNPVASESLCKCFDDLSFRYFRISFSYMRDKVSQPS